MIVVEIEPISFNTSNIFTNSLASSNNHISKSKEGSIRRGDVVCRLSTDLAASNSRFVTPIPPPEVLLVEARGHQKTQLLVRTYHNAWLDSYSRSTKYRILTLHLSFCLPIKNANPAILITSLSPAAIDLCTI
jgi:hypothetical protein